MTAIIILAIFALFLGFFYPSLINREPEETEIEKISPKAAKQLKKLMSIATDAIKEQRTLRAEKALLTILKFDERNATAYNRLGIIYGKEHKFKEAIDCFEIANGIEENAASLHNGGLMYLELEKFEKASALLARSIELEPDVPAHYIAFSKAQEKLGNRLKALQALEESYNLQPNPTILKYILGVYKEAGNEEGIERTEKRIRELIAAKEAKNPPKQIKKPFLKPKKKVIQ
jgi:tetratricopeptide (TPR) repeat protein